MMKIKATIERIPGGMMLVPLVLGAILNTLAPNTGAYFGGFTKGMITGTVPILAVWFFCIGASINLRATGTVLRKSGTLVITKIAVAWVVAMICAMFIPENGIQTGFFAGLSVLAIVSAMDMTNGWPLRQPDEPVRHQRRVWRLRSDVSGIRPTDDHADPRLRRSGLL